MTKCPETKERTLAHYAKMFGWILCQDPEEYVSTVKMDIAIGEKWCGDSCPHCNEFYDETAKDSEACNYCPLIPENNDGCKDCCDGLWRKMSSSYTWGEFLINMIQVIKYIRRHG